MCRCLMENKNRMMKQMIKDHRNIIKLVITLRILKNRLLLLIKQRRLLPIQRKRVMLKMKTIVLQSLKVMFRVYLSMPNLRYQVNLRQQYFRDRHQMIKLSMILFQIWQMLLENLHFHNYIDHYFIFNIKIIKILQNLYYFCY